MLLHSLLYYCGFKRIIKGNTKEIKERVLRPKTVVERGGFFFLFYHLYFHHCRYREAGLLINFFIIQLFHHCITLFKTILPTIFYFSI